MTTTDTTAIATQPESILTSVGREYGLSGVDYYDTLQANVFRGKGRASKEQVQALLVIAKAYNLNPLAGEIWAYPGKGGGIIPIVSVDGWYNIMNTHPATNGFEVAYTADKDGNLLSYKAKVHRTDRAHTAEIEELLSENFRPTDPWRNQPHRMLRHRAMVQAIRMTFSLSGIYDPDEGQRIYEAEAEVITSSPALDKQEARLTPPEPEEKEEAPVDPDNAPDDLTYQPKQAPETTDSLYDDE